MLPVLGRRPAQPPGQHDRQRDLVELQRSSSAASRRRGCSATRTRRASAPATGSPSGGRSRHRRRPPSGRWRRGRSRAARPGGTGPRTPSPRASSVPHTHGIVGDAIDAAAVQLVLGGLQHHQRLVVELFALPVARARSSADPPATEVARPAARRSRRPCPRTRRPSERCAALRAAGVSAPKPIASVIARCPLRPVSRVRAACTTLPGVGCREATVERPVGCEIAPGIARRAGVAARRLPQARLGDHGAGRRVVPGEQRRVLGAAAVVVAVVAGRRVGQQVHLQRPAGQRLEAHVRQHGRARGIGDPGLDEAPAGGLRRLPEGQRPGLRPHLRPDARVGLAVQERLAVGHRELEVAEARRAEVRVVDLRQLGGAQREPRRCSEAGWPSRTRACPPAPRCGAHPGRRAPAPPGRRRAPCRRPARTRARVGAEAWRTPPVSYPRTVVREHPADGEGGIRTLGRG